MEKIGVKLPKFGVLSLNGNRAVLLALSFFAWIFFPSSEICSQSVKGIKTVVIDAGHGGKDPGCHGNFAHEKHVCLEMAWKLGDLIKKKYPEIKVIYTRDKDVFVELIERANIATKAKADLFICIHANAGAAAAYGTETYVLGLHRTESQQKVAERENSIISLEDDKGAKYKDFDLSPDAIIAKQLQLSVFLNHSILFAENLQREFKRIGRHDRGVKQAGFLVLYKTTMPSVLIESGFLTNPTEEKFLGSKDGQTQMAEAMFKAFENYKNQLEGNKSSSPGKESPSSSGSGTASEQATEKSETIAVATIEENILPTDTSGLIFRVQIETSERKIAPQSPRFKGLEVFEYKQDKFFKYCTGAFPKDLVSAKHYKNELVEMGFANAFVVAFYNGERISIEKAIKLAEK
jgi:N-acetylmuramoyl-L-alanine amidase